MEINSAQGPMNQPNIPISEDEMSQNPGQASGKNTFLTLASLLVLVAVIGTTLFLYIQNRTAPKKTSNNAAPNTTSEVTPTTPGNNDLKGPFTFAQRTTIPKKVICYRFTSLKEALMNIDAACVLDLSGKNLNSLPDEITKLTKLNTIDLGVNNFTEFPPQLLNITTLLSINLRGNRLTTTPDVSKLKNLQSLILTGNPIKNKVTPTPGKTPSTLTITY